MRTVHALLMLLVLCLYGSMTWAGTIYYYKGPDGVLHFTDLPKTKQYKPFIFWGDAKGEAKKRIKKLIGKYASRYGMDEALILALAHVESRYNAKAVSRAGAQGVMQIMPDTQKELGLTAPFDPAANVEAGIRYFKQMQERFGDTRLALAAYNAGPGPVERYKGVPPFPETQKYVQDVLGMYAKLKPKTP